MSNEGDIVDSILAFLGGAFLGYVIYRILKGDNYTCPHCGYKNVPNNSSRCPNCGSKLRWVD